MTTYVLHGVTDRDPNERVCQFFATTEDREDFAGFLPGQYDRMTLHGINFNEFEVEVEGFDEDYEPTGYIAPVEAPPADNQRPTS